MASVGHVAIGMAVARARHGRASTRMPLVAAMVAWSALSLAPDADVIGFPLGVHYDDPWGHRGATHSLAFAAAAGLVVGVIARVRGRPGFAPGVTASAVVASHPVLDTLTNGGLGCALLWPFDATRYFAPWNPIPVAPIGFDFLSPRGLEVAVTELVLFAPLIAFAVWPRISKRREPS